MSFPFRWPFCFADYSPAQEAKWYCQLLRQTLQRNGRDSIWSSGLVKTRLPEQFLHHAHADGDPVAHGVRHRVEELLCARGRWQLIFRFPASGEGVGLRSRGATPLSTLVLNWGEERWAGLGVEELAAQPPPFLRPIREHFHLQSELLQVLATLLHQDLPTLSTLLFVQRCAFGHVFSPDGCVTRFGEPWQR